MKPIITLATALALVACDNPVEHFTDPPKDSCTIVIPKDPTPDPKPPGFPEADTTECRP